MSRDARAALAPGLPTAAKPRSVASHPMIFPEGPSTFVVGTLVPIRAFVGRLAPNAPDMSFAPSGLGNMHNRKTTVPNPVVANIWGSANRWKGREAPS